MTVTYIQIFWAVTLSIILRFVLVSIYRVTYHPLAKYPGPFLAKLTDLYAAWHAATGNIHLAIKAGHDKWGPTMRFGPNKLIFNSPEHFHQVYNSPQVKRAAAFALMTPTPGTYNLISTLDKTVHRRKRRILATAFSEESWRGFEPKFLEVVDTFIRVLLEGGSANGSGWSSTKNMTEVGRHLALDVVGEFAFGYPFQTLEHEKHRFLLKLLSVSHFRTSVYMQFPALEPWKLELFYPKILLMRNRFFTLTSQIARWRLDAGKEAKSDVFSIVSKTTDPETGQAMSFDEIWAESTFLLGAGGDTIASTLSALFFYLASYPECYDRLAKEVRSTFAASEQISAGRVLKDCSYLQACVREALRMNPAVASVPWREVEAPGIEIDGRLVPAGVDVGTSPYALQHSSHLFPAPSVFKPERWLGDDPTTADRRAFAAFGIGPSRCLGRDFVMRELSLVVAQALSQCDFRFDQGDSGRVGRGDKSRGLWRADPAVFQSWDHITAVTEGPCLQFRRRKANQTNVESSAHH